MMHNRNQLVDIGKKTYLYLYGIGIFLVIFSTSRFKDPNFLTINASVMSLIVAVILVCISLFYTRVYTYDEILFIVVTVILGVGTTFISRGTEPLMMALYIISSRKINPYDIMRVLLIVNIFLFIINYFLFKMGILLDFQNFSIDKHSFGYNHPNQFGISIFSVITILMVATYNRIYQKGILKYGLLVLQAPLLLLIFQSGSRGAEIATLITYLIFFVLLVANKHQNFLFLMGTFVLMGAVIFSLYTTSSSVNTVGSFLYNLNQVFTQRLQLNNYFYQNYGVSILGQKVFYNLNATVGSNYAIIDNAYVKLIVNYGLVYTISYIGYIILIMKRVVLKKEVALLIPIISFIVYGLIEQGFIQYWVNFSMLFSGVLFYNKGNIK